MFIKFRNLDENGDWEFGKGNQCYGNEQQSTLLNIQTRLKSVKYDCFFDLTSGIDWFNILGNRGKYSKDVIEINVRLCILQSLYVTEIIDLKITENLNRKLNLEYTINTIFGIITDKVVLGG